MQQKEVRYEEAAEVVTTTGWVCKNCRRFWGKDEGMARWCCATNLPCPECDGRRNNKGYSVCTACRDKKEAERWAAHPRVEWDGETPLVLGDCYFFSLEDFADYIANEYDHEGPPTLEEIEALRLELCVRPPIRSFNLLEYLGDDLPEDWEPAGWEEMEKLINDWMKFALTGLWTAGGGVVSATSVLAHLTPLNWGRWDMVDNTGATP